MTEIKEYTQMMIKELAEYSILRAFIYNDKFSEFAIKEIKNTDWGIEFGFSKYMRDELFEDILFEEDTSGFMCYNGSPFSLKIDDVFFLDDLVIIDFSIMGTNECKLVMNENKLTVNLSVNNEEVLPSEFIDKTKIYKNNLS